MVFPAEFLNILNQVPDVPRPFKVFDADRVKKMMQLAMALLETSPNEITQRTVQYFIKICDAGAQPDPVPLLHWVGQRTPNDVDQLEQLDVSRCRPAARLLPQMRFTARLRRRR